MTAAADDRARLAAARRVVVKVGSQLLADEQGVPDGASIRRFAADVDREMAAGRQLLVVTSGAIAYGRQALADEGAPATITAKQVHASVGQPLLMDAWRRSLQRHGRAAAQVLLTHHVVADREAYLNAHATLTALLDRGVVPVINENDAVGHEEIRYGDNDELAALVAVMVEADLLILLTSPDGLYRADPALDPAAVRIPRLGPGDDPIATGEATAEGRSTLGSGGMASKIAAARVAARAGVAVVVSAGREARPVGRVFDDAAAGTLVEPAPVPLVKRRHWLRHGLRARGRLHLDAGASEALRRRGASVLPVGIVRVEGEFPRGAAVAIVGADGAQLARGLAAYPADELRRLCGQRSDAIESILGYRYQDVAVHRDNLILEE